MCSYLSIKYPHCLYCHEFSSRTHLCNFEAPIDKIPLPFFPQLKSEAFKTEYQNCNSDYWNYFKEFALLHSQNVFIRHTFESSWQASNTLFRKLALCSQGAIFLVNGRMSSIGFPKVTDLDIAKILSISLSSLGSSCSYLIPATMHQSTFNTVREKVFLNLTTPLSLLIFFRNRSASKFTSAIITLCMV